MSYVASVSGQLGGDEIREVKPAIEEMMNTDEVRIVELIAPDYEGFGPADCSRI